MNPTSEVPSTRAILYLAALMLIAAGLQSAFAVHLMVFGGEPDFPFTLSMVAALLGGSSVGALTGLAGGLITASLVGQTVGTYLVSRTIAGWVAGWSTSRLYRGNPGVVILGVLMASLIADTVYFLAAPRTGMAHGIRPSLIGSVWNSLLAWPMMLLLRRCGWGNRI